MHIQGRGDGTSITHSTLQTRIPVPTATLHTPSSTIGITVPNRNATSQPSTVPTIAPTFAPTATPTSAPVQAQVALDSFFNNEGIGNVPGQANFDGNGYSYPANQFPDTGPGTNDNIVAFGQTISLTPGKYRQAFLLAASSWGPANGTVVIKYTDGSTNMRDLAVLDWYSSPGALNTTYRYTSNGIDNHPVYIYAVPISLDSTRVAAALILPDQQTEPYQNGHIHVFALTLLS